MSAFKPIKDILFIRKYPTSFEKTSPRKKWLKSCIDRRGTTVHYAGHNITFFFPGCGRRLRRLHPAIIDKLNTGQITDIVDIGGGGALNPDLKCGDLVMATEDIPFDTLQPLGLRSRKEITDIVKLLALKNVSSFYEGKILTHEKIIFSREARIKLYESTQCLVVQLEHCWFLRSLQSVLEPKYFNSLYVTHIEVISDAVPTSNTFTDGLVEAFHGLNTCILRNQYHLGKIKSNFLTRWLGSSSRRD